MALFVSNYITKLVLKQRFKVWLTFKNIKCEKINSSPSINHTKKICMMSQLIFKIEQIYGTVCKLVKVYSEKIYEIILENSIPLLYMEDIHHISYLFVLNFDLT